MCEAIDSVFPLVLSGNVSLENWWQHILIKPFQLVATSQQWRGAFSSENNLKQTRGRLNIAFFRIFWKKDGSWKKWRPLPSDKVAKKIINLHCWRFRAMGGASNSWPLNVLMPLLISIIRCSTLKTVEMQKLALIQNQQQPQQQQQQQTGNGNGNFESN